MRYHEGVLRIFDSRTMSGTPQTVWDRNELLQNIHTAWRGKLGRSRCEWLRFKGVVDRGGREDEDEDLAGAVLL